MNSTLKTTFLTCLIHSFCITAGFAQQIFPRYEIGVNAGTFIYQGDLTPSAVGSFKTPAWALGLNGTRNLSKVLAIRLDMSIGRLKGDDAKYANPEWRRQRNFNFKTSVTELIASLVYTPLGKVKRITPYLFAGLGYSFVNIKRDYSGYNAGYFSGESLSEELVADIDHRLPKAIPIVPFGIGFRYTLSQKLSLTTEAGYRYMRTDYLDGFSQAANPDRDDQYYKFSIGIQYAFGKKDKYDCPVIKQ